MSQKGPKSLKPANGHIRCANLFPSYFKNIDEMTAYLYDLHQNGINTVWVNPLQLAGKTSMSKADAATGISQRVGQSIYAMQDPVAMDPRFSVVARDSDGDMQLTPEQIAYLHSQSEDSALLGAKFQSVHIAFDAYSFATLIKQIKVARSKIDENQAVLSKVETEQTALLKGLRTDARKHSHKELFLALVANIDKLSSVPLQNAKLSDLNINLDDFPAAKSAIKDAEQPFGAVLKQLGIGSDAFYDMQAVLKKKQQLEIDNKALQSQYQRLQSIQSECIHILDKRSIIHFTTTAKSLGMTPIFDLVLNHVSSSAPVTVEHPEWFGDDKTYPDATCFKYSEILQFTHLKSEECDALIAKDSEHLAYLSKKIKERDLSVDDKNTIYASTKLSIDEKEQLILKLRFRHTIEARAKIAAQIPTIMQAFWAPFIQKYVEYGFCGARVDCVRKVPKDVRQSAYDLLKQQVQAKEGQDAHVVILEEALFSDLDAKQFTEVVQGAGATHITGSIFNNERQWDGGLTYDYGYEDYHKRTMVSKDGGVINFTGNHDHYSCAMMACRELAFERLKENTTLYREYLASMPQSHAMQDIHKTVYIHHFVEQIIRELADPDKYYKQCMRFGMLYRDKLLTNMFSGSGGYYMLSGDELATLEQPTVFLRENGEKLYPESALKMLVDKSDSFYPLAHKAIFTLAKARIQKDSSFKHSYARLDEANKGILLSTYSAQIINEVNANLESTAKDFMTALHQEYALALLTQQSDQGKVSKQAVEAVAKANLSKKKKPPRKGGVVKETPEAEQAALEAEVIRINESLLKRNGEVDSYVSEFSKLVNKPEVTDLPRVRLPRNAANGWARPDFMKKFAHKKFIKEVNTLLDKLPPSKDGFWSEIFKRDNKNILVIARKNGFGFTSPTDLIIINLNPDKSYEITQEDIHKMAVWLQERKFGKVYLPENEEFRKAYGSLMGSEEFKINPANLYFGGRLTVSQDVKDYGVNFDGQAHKFNIVVSPKVEEPELLLPGDALLTDPDDVFALGMSKKYLPLATAKSAKDMLPTIASVATAAVAANDEVERLADQLKKSVSFQ